MKNNIIRITLIIAAINFGFLNFAAASNVNLQGEWDVYSASDIYDYSGSLLVFDTQVANGLDYDITGYFDWYRNGNYVGTELFSGIFFEDNTLQFAGYQLINPNSISLANYSGLVTEDGNSIVNGIWWPPQGTWEATRAVPLPASIWFLSSVVIGLFCIRKRK